MKVNYLKTILFAFFFYGSFVLTADEDIEEVLVTGSYIQDAVDSIGPLEVLSEDDFISLNITNLAEISKYLNIASGSHFQSNTLGGVDQGMSSITLRGLDHASTLLLINSKRHTFAGTPSNEGEGYIDVNIIPEISFKRIEILKEGATSLYGSDAVAGVINFITHKDFKGLKIRFGDQTTTNYNQKDQNIGFLYGRELNNWDLVFAANLLDRAPLSASEIPNIAELALSGLGNTFITTAADEITEGRYEGVYEANQIVPDPNCVENGGILQGFCRFLYGTRFNIVNTEDHSKFYLNLSNDIHNLSLIASNVRVIDNPQSPSYPALPFLTRLIQPGEGSSPFNTPVKWRGRPLGSQYASPFSPKDIKQFHLNYSYFTKIENVDFEFSLSTSEHQNKHNRPDIIDSRFQSAMQGSGGPSQNETWNIFEPELNSQSLIDYVRGAEISNKTGSLSVFDVIGRSKLFNFDFAFGSQISDEKLDISYNEIARAEFDRDGKIIKTADLFFLGGGKNVSTNRNKVAFFLEGRTNLAEVIDISLSGRYEESKNYSSFDPKVSIKSTFNENIFLRGSFGSSFSMPSMAQMFSSNINLGSVRDIEGNIFVRQAQIGNPDLKPSTADNSNFGIILDYKNRIFTIDYWLIDYKNRVESQSSQALLLSDPFGPSITRNDEGELIGVTTTYFNETTTKLSGFDFSYDENLILEDYGKINLSVKGTSFIEFLTPEIGANASSNLVNRVGRFNFDANTHSIPKYRINSFLNWNYGNYEVALNTRFIDGYMNERSIPESALSQGYKNKIDNFLVFDLTFRQNFPQFFDNMNFKTSFSIINILDEQPPKIYDAPDFSFDTRVHDPRGRLINIQFELAPKN